MHKKITKEAKIASWVTLLNESDKGSLLLIAGIVDRMLEQILNTAIHANLHNLPQLPNDFEKNLFHTNGGALHTFSARINVALAFNLIDHREYKALHVLKDLRNEAAHCYFDYSLSDPGVAARLEELKWYGNGVYREAFLKEEGVKERETSDRFQFVLRSYGLFMKLAVAQYEQIRRFKKLTKGVDLPEVPRKELLEND